MENNKVLPNPQKTDDAVTLGSIATWCFFSFFLLANGHTLLQAYEFTLDGSDFAFVISLLMLGLGLVCIVHTAALIVKLVRHKIKNKMSNKTDEKATL